MFIILASCLKTEGDSQLLYTTFMTTVLFVIAIIMLVGVTQQLLLGANSWILLDCEYFCGNLTCFMCLFYLYRACCIVMHDA